MTKNFRSKHSYCLLLLLDKIRNGKEKGGLFVTRRYLIVEVFDMHPLDSLSLILFLFLLQNELDEELLQLLVAVVNAELLEGVTPEDFESVDIKDGDDRSRFVA